MKVRAAAIAERQLSCADWTSGVLPYKLILAALRFEVISEVGKAFFKMSMRWCTGMPSFPISRWLYVLTVCWMASLSHMSSGDQQGLLCLVSDFAWELSNQSCTSLNIRENGVWGHVLTCCFVEDISGLILLFSAEMAL